LHDAFIWAKAIVSNIPFISHFIYNITIYSLFFVHPTATQ
jgi:hypothetical protein